MTELTAMEFITTQMEPNMKENGSRINNMGEELKLGLMVQSIKAPTRRGRKKVKENLFGVIRLHMRETLATITSMVISILNMIRVWRICLE